MSYDCKQITGTIEVRRKSDSQIVDSVPIDVWLCVNNECP